MQMHFFFFCNFFSKVAFPYECICDTNEGKCVHQTILLIRKTLVLCKTCQKVLSSKIIWIQYLLLWINVFWKWGIILKDCPWLHRKLENVLCFVLNNLFGENCHTAVTEFFREWAYIVSLCIKKHASYKIA